MDDKKLLKTVSQKDQTGTRLQSLKLPRDLNLGMSKPKKQYTPNLKVVRNKDKTKELLKKVDQKRKDRTSFRDRHNRKDGKNQYIQSTGIFSQGSADLRRPNVPNERPSVVRDSSATPSVVVPKINKNIWAINKKEEDSVLDELINGDSDSDDEKTSFKPLTLTPHLKRSKDNCIIKNDTTEFEDDDELKTTNVTVDNDLIPECFLDDDIYEDNPAISIVQLPHSFAGKGLSDDPNVKKLFDYPLSSMLEGQIGKLIIRRSGKIEAQIGSIHYEVLPEGSLQCKEDLVTVSETNGDTSIAVLGKIVNHFVMYPDYNALLK